MPGTTRRNPTSYTTEDNEEFTRLIPGEEEDNKDVGVTSKSTTRKKKPSKMLLLAGAAMVLMVAVVSIKNSFFGMTAIVGVGATEVKVKCQNVYMPELTAPTFFYRYSRICYPDDGKKYPLHLFGHGDFGGGPFSFAYHGLINDIASRGFVVSMYLSCAIDQMCDDGNGSFLEILKSMSFLETNTGWWNNKIDFDAGYSASGHSTGGRAVLMLAGLIDSPTKYLATTKYASMITNEQRKSIQKFQAIIGDHPDPVYLPGFNPDVDNYVVDKTPVMIVTGSEDHIEPELSAWKDFETITSLSKVYVDMLGTGHLGPLLGHKEGPYIAYFSQCYIKGIGNDVAAKGCANIYSDSVPDAMRKVLKISTISDRNTGDGRVGYLGCRGDDQGDVPVKFTEFCSAEN